MNLQKQKKAYRSPAIKVVALKHRARLLQNSGKSDDDADQNLPVWHGPIG